MATCANGRNQSVNLYPLQYALQSSFWQRPLSTFILPTVIADLAIARNRLLEHYRSANLEFALKGNMVGKRCFPRALTKLDWAFQKNAATTLMARMLQIRSSRPK